MKGIIFSRRQGLTFLFLNCQINNDVINRRLMIFYSVSS